MLVKYTNIIITTCNLVTLSPQWWIPLKRTSSGFFTNSSLTLSRTIRKSVLALSGKKIRFEISHPYYSVRIRIIMLKIKLCVNMYYYIYVSTSSSLRWFRIYSVTCNCSTGRNVCWKSWPDFIFRIVVTGLLIIFFCTFNTFSDIWNIQWVNYG